MSDLAESDGDAPEMLAAEYVLGTLDAGEVMQADARRGSDAAFDAEIQFWERRLYPLAALVAGLPAPPAVWTRIEASIGGQAAVAGMPVAPANDNRVGAWWRPVALGAMAVAAGLAVFLAVRPVPAPQYAILAPAGGNAAVLVAFAGGDGGLLVRASRAVVVAADKDLELWALPAGASQPAALGVLPAGGRRISGVAVGTQLLVSLEPKGGSTTGLPTGPVVYGGVLQQGE